ncbi:hypothetical protein LSH36_742g01054 [Paralvinella palmiformis]|uniref:C2H2-type domain-containing protein n=1 Tax=Paralvinella palmiformis TaxID=53620 RepID=A0AAD9MUI8_9ANNE|nr:hypothetical protein LSH36_742g01054 [Paralvinella palmiformis]
MCKNGLKFETKFTIDAVIGVTLDEKEVFLISVNEIFRTKKESAISDEDSSNVSDVEMGSISRRKKRKRNRLVKRELGSDGESGHEQDDDRPDAQSESLNRDSNDDNSIMFIKEEPHATSWPTSSCSFQDPNAGEQSELTFSPYPGADVSHDATDLKFADASFPSNVNQSMMNRSCPRQQASSAYLSPSGNHTVMSQIGGDHTQGANQVIEVSPDVVYICLWWMLHPLITSFCQNISFSWRVAFQSYVSVEVSVDGKQNKKAPSGSADLPRLLAQLPSLRTSHKHGTLKPKHNRFCDLCGKRFTSQYGYQVHLKRHQGIHPYTCEVCGKASNRVRKAHSQAAGKCDFPMAGRKCSVMSALDESCIGLPPGHYPRPIPSTPAREKPTKRCRICYMKGRRKEVRHYCVGCLAQPGLCLGECFRLFHTGPLPTRKTSTW